MCSTYTVRIDSRGLQRVGKGTHLVHEDFDTGVQPSCDRIVQYRLESLLFPHDGVQKIGLVDIARQFLVKVDLDHRLNRIANMDELKELEERRHRLGFLVLGRLVGAHLICCTTTISWPSRHHRAMTMQGPTFGSPG